MGSSIPVWVQCTPLFPTPRLCSQPLPPRSPLSSLPLPLFQPLQPARGSCTPPRIVESCFSLLSSCSSGARLLHRFHSFFYSRHHVPSFFFFFCCFGPNFFANELKRGCTQLGQKGEDAKTFPIGEKRGQLADGQDGGFVLFARHAKYIIIYYREEATGFLVVTLNDRNRNETREIANVTSRFVNNSGTHKCVNSFVAPC